MGRPPDLKLELPQTEGLYNVVADIQIFIPGAVVATSKCCGSTFYTDVSIPRAAKTVTIFGGYIQKQGDKTWLRNTPETEVVVHTAWDFEKSLLVETCAGIGAVDRGYKHCGIHRVVYSDINPRFCKWLSDRGQQVVQGDICDSKVVKQLAKCNPLIVSGGVSCQPFSELGDKREENDDRSRSFTGVLQAAYEMQAPIIILECTPAVFRSEWAQDVLKQFAASTKFRVQQTIQELHTLWPAKRTRWWCVITHPDIGMGPIGPPPPARFQPTLMHLFRRCIDVNPKMLQELELSLYETRVFHTMSGGLKKHAVDFTKPMPTATHSWGSQLSSCACGCREKGFNMDRLENRGLYGQVIPLQHTRTTGNDTIQALRHLHPSEVAIANCLPGDYVGTSNELKLELAGVGQMASPLQGLWMLAQVFQHLGKKFDTPKIDPIACMKALAFEVFATRDLLMPPSGPTSYMKLFEDAWQHYGETDIPRQVELFEYDQDPDDMCHAKDLGQSHEETSKATPAMVNPVVAPGNAEEAPRDGHVGDPEQENHRNWRKENIQERVHQTMQHSTPKPESDLDDLDRCILAEQSVRVHPAKSTESFKRGAVPGFEAVPKKRPRVEDISIPKESFPLGTTKVEQSIGVQTDQVSEVKTPQVGETQEKNDETSFQVIEVHVSSNHSPIQMIVMPVGTKYGNLCRAEQQLQNNDHLHLTNAVGQTVSEEDAIRHGDILCFEPIHEQINNIPVLQHDKRDILLWQQKGWVAWDEMRFYQMTIEKEANGQTHEGLALSDSPATATDWSFWVLKVAKLLGGNQMGRVASYVLWKQHWIPVGFSSAGEAGETFVITSTPEAIPIFQQWAKQAWQEEADDIQWQVMECPCVFQNDCGFQATAWIQAFVKNAVVDSVSAYQAGQNRAAFHRYLEMENLAQAFVTNPLCLGGMSNCEEKLMVLLQEHGVAKARSSECASHLIQTLGKNVIQQILTSAKPWADLKTRASMVRPPIRIVLAEELQATIDRRMQEGSVVGRKNNKAKGKAKTDELFKLRADQIHIPMAVFCQADGTELEQIPACDIGSEARGIVVTNIEEALPYFRLQKPMTSEGLALLILDFEDARIPAQKELIKVPAICRETQEPVLLQVAMLQIGSKQVGRNVPSQCIQIQEVENCVVRAMVYKDQFPDEWQEFIKHPVRHIMQNPIFAQHQQEILDVWDRQFLSIRMAKTPQADSAIFVVCIRVQSNIAESLCQVSGTDGLYCEPRSTTGRQPDDAFQVIWLPKKSFGEAQLAVRTSQVKAVLARSGDRYGLRVANEQAAIVHQQHRPEVMFIKGTELRKFRVGPLPYGSTRQSIANVFRKWEWEARPLGPYAQSKDRTGMIWTAQAAKPPENLVYQLAHGDVLITPEAPMSHMPSFLATPVVASEKTMQCLKQSSQKDEKRDDKKNDPWLHYDPWQSSTKQGKEVSVAQFAALQSKIEAAVDQKLQKIQQDDPMASAADSRINTLEQQVHDLATSVQNFQTQQVQQNQRLHAQIQSVDQKVEHQQQSLHQMLDAKLEDQMARIEQLFTKRARME